MKLIVVLVAMTGVVKGLPQYDYPRPDSSNGYKYDRPGSGTQLANGGKEPGVKKPASGGEDNNLPSKEVTNEEGEEGTEQETPEDQEPLIHKHIYVHIAPPELEEEPEEPKTPKPGRVEKHYKIIFIKAPAPQTPGSLSIPAQPAREEKTIVYVLVKKPEAAKEVTIPTSEPTEPSKPEVYFIRYKATGKKEEGKEETDGTETSAAPETETGANGANGANVANGASPSSPSYLPPSNRLRTAPNSQDYDY